MVEEVEETPLNAHRHPSVVLVVVVILLAAGGFSEWYHQAVDQPDPPADGAATVPEPRDPSPAYLDADVLFSAGLHPHRLENPSPLLAVVIDDLGWGAAVIRDLLEAGIPLTCTVLPDGPFTARDAQLVLRAGHDLFLHVPMEPLQPRPHAGRIITCGADPHKVRQLLEDWLAQVPGAVGISNHMGSRACADPGIVDVLLDVAAEHGLLVLDSRTSPRSLIAARARERGLIAFENCLFLDNQRDFEAIKRQLRKAVEWARRHGHAVVIGHPHESMLRALRWLVTELPALGVRPVKLSEIATGR